MSDLLDEFLDAFEMRFAFRGRRRCVRCTGTGAHVGSCWCAVVVVVVAVVRVGCSGRGFA